MASSRRSKADIERELEELKNAYQSLKKLYEHDSEVLEKGVVQRSQIDTELNILHAAIKQSPFMTLITDLDGVITFVNSRFSEITGYAPEEVIGENVKILKGEYATSFDYSEMWKTILAGNTWNGILNNRKKNGEHNMESAIVTPIKNSKDQITHFLFFKEDITFGKKIEIDLQTTNANLNVLLENTTEIIWSINVNYEIIQLNNSFRESFQALHGVTLVPGMNILEALPEKSRAQWKENYDKALNNNRFSFEEVFEIGDSKLYVEVAMSPILLKDKVVGVTVFSRNISPYRQAQTDLARSNAFLDSVINEMPNMVFIKEAKELRFVRLNKAGESILGLSKSHFIGKTDHDLFPCEMANAFVAYDRQVLEGGEMVEISCEPVATARGIRYLHTRKVPVLNAKGEAEFLLGISDDITDKLISEEKLRLSEERYHLLSDVTIEGIALVKGDTIIDLNSALVRLAGRNDSSELLNSSILNLLATEDHFFWTLMNSTTENVKFEIKLHRSNDQFVSCEMESRLYSDKNTTYRVVAFRDITDRKLAEKSLETVNSALLAANADKDRFIAILGHDLRSPFNALLGFSRLLVESVRELDVDTIESYATLLNNTAENTYNLLEDILIWATLKTGNAPFQPKSISLYELVASVLASLHVAASAKEITISNMIDESVMISADANMLKTILRNLVANAIKFSYKGGAVHVYTEASIYGVTVVVKDEGVGLTAKLVESLFDVTKKQSAVGTAGEKGTGLGLILCKEFVEKHCGKIWVESEFGKGARFKITLPSSY